MKATISVAALFIFLAFARVCSAQFGDHGPDNSPPNNDNNPGNDDHNPLPPNNNPQPGNNGYNPPHEGFPPSPTARAHEHGWRPRPGHFGGFPSWLNTPNENKNENVTRTLYAGLVAPYAQDIVDAHVFPPGLFSPNCTGRITPVGEFDDAEGTYEYFYGLAAATNIILANVVRLIAKGNLVAVRVDLLFNTSKTTQLGVNDLQNLTQEGFITFDENNLITSYDLTILRLGLASNVPVSQDAGLIQKVCLVASIYCVGENYQYANISQCIDYLTNVIPYGTHDNLSSNTVCCREVHAALVPLRPAFHCPHVGPTGGDACIDTPYAEWYDEYF